MPVPLISTLACAARDIKGSIFPRLLPRSTNTGFGKFKLLGQELYWLTSINPGPVTSECAPDCIRAYIRENTGGRETIRFVHDVQDGQRVDLHYIHHDAFNKARIFSLERNTESDRCGLDTLTGITALGNLP